MRTQKKSNMHLQKAIIIHVASGLSFRKYEQGPKQEARGGHSNLKFHLKKWLHINVEAQWTTSLIYKKKGV